MPGFARWSLLLALTGGYASAPGADLAPASAPPQTAPPAGTAPGRPQSPPPSAASDLFDLGRGLFEAYAPEEIKAQYDFPSRTEWERFLPKLQAALQGDSFAALADCEPEARTVLAALRLWPEAADYADWLADRIDMIEVAKAPPPPAAPVPPKVQPGPTPRELEAALPGYTIWREKISRRPVPGRAAEWLPVAQRAFSLEKIPPALSWLAEVESSFNPSARSPAGAVGLYQLMAPTAQTLGLRIWLPDERLQPAASARAAARLLASLYARFGDWPLALAAYNAGEGRVRRAIAVHGPQARFANIASSLSVETRLYVPKVYATVETRNFGLPEQLFFKR